MRTVHTEFFYAASPERLWTLATSYDALSRVMAGLVEFDGLPEGRTRTGQKIHVEISLFGKLPKQPYDMDVLECDDSRMILRSSEQGAGVKSWRHTMMVTPAPGGSRLCDTIEIDAGLLTPAFALWAKYLYGARHKPRQRLLEEGSY
ncbi:SRPBCC family protein [Salipiger abyssi]|uniref:SRPBCC family protein n=1 Tax=Salipiger abyssi TaxID=1250539 RepID=UPI001A8D0179|nr:SRPBCC family protein [Salipiger abyssi]MBN9886247.1 SRPBCC family protein [Salipiger abyssi]